MWMMMMMVINEASSFCNVLLKWSVLFYSGVQSWVQYYMLEYTYNSFERQHCLFEITYYRYKYIFTLFS